MYGTVVVLPRVSIRRTPLKRRTVEAGPEGVRLREVCLSDCSLSQLTTFKPLYIFLDRAPGMLKL